MKQLKPGYQLSFPSDKEVRVTYPPNPNIWVGRLSNLVLSISVILFLLSVVTELVSWNLIVIFLGLSAVSILFRVRFPSNNLKEITLKTDNFKYAYVIGMNNREQHISPPVFIDFSVTIQSDLIKVSFMEIVLDLYNMDDLPIFIDKIAEMFNMKYVDTCRLSNNQEVLMYQQKNLSTIIYPTLINVVWLSNGVEFHDMANQFFWLKFDELHQQIFYYDKNTMLPKLMIPYHDVQQIDVIFNAGKWVENGKNRIIINVILNNLTKQMVFETTLRTKKQELTSYRDTNLIFMEMKKLQHLKSIKITKQFNIQ